MKYEEKINKLRKVNKLYRNSVLDVKLSTKNKCYNEKITINLEKVKDNSPKYICLLALLIDIFSKLSKSVITERHFQKTQTHTHIYILSLTYETHMKTIDMKNLHD